MEGMRERWGGCKCKREEGVGERVEGEGTNVRQKKGSTRERETRREKGKKGRKHEQHILHWGQLVFMKNTHLR